MNKLKCGQIWRKGDGLHYLLIEFLEDASYIQLVHDGRWKANCLETAKTVSMWMNPQIDTFIQEG